MKGSELRQLLTSLVSYGKITTTEAKAKALKSEIDRLISRSKDLSLVTRRKALSLFTQKSAALKFLEQVVPQFSQRVGGYVRITKLSYRRGDHAPMARIEFVEEIKEKVKPVKAAKTGGAVAKSGGVKKVAKKGTKSAKKAK